MFDLEERTPLFGNVAPQTKRSVPQTAARERARPAHIVVFLSEFDDGFSYCACGTKSTLQATSNYSRTLYREQGIN